MFDNLILDADSYKHSHFQQYPASAAFISSYIEARGVSKDFVDTDYVVFFGLQAWLKSIQELKFADIQQAEDIVVSHGLPFNRRDWEWIVGHHAGTLPLFIEAVEEGKRYPIRTPLVQVRNTVPGYGWVTSFIETSLLRAVWYPSTVATLASRIKDIMLPFYQTTCDDLSGLEFALHDFGARGVSSKESATLGSMAHQLSFRGTDALSGILGIKKFYEENYDYMPSFSVPAMEHSTVTSWTRSKEVDAYRNMILRCTKGDTGALFSIVCDSYDYEETVRDIFCGSLLDTIKESGGKLVIRPDSGNPVDVIMNILGIIEEKTGDVTRNSKGFKVLPSYFGLLQGDGVSPEDINNILLTMTAAGWAANNIVFGMGGGLLQKVNRDSLKFAMKCNAMRTWGDDDWTPIQKIVKSDPSKASRAGRIADDNLPTVWVNGNFMREYNSFENLRKNLTQKL